MLTTVPILHHIQMIHQVMDQAKVHDLFLEREEIPFHQYPNTEEDTRIPIHQEVTMEGIGMTVLVEIPVVNLIAQEDGLEGIPILGFQKIAVTLAQMSPFQDTHQDGHSMSTTAGLVGISERVFTLYPEAFICPG